MKRFAIVALTAFFALSAWANEAPDVMVKRITEEVLHIVRTDKALQNGDTNRAIELVNQKVLPYFDFQRMTSLAVGKDWRKATPEQKHKLSEEFKTLLVRTYSNALTGYKSQTIRYKPFRMKPEDTEVTVQTEILQPGSQAIPLDYSIEKQSKDWKVYDVVVGGISLVTNYRDQFRQEVRETGIDGLINAIATKNKTTANKK